MTMPASAAGGGGGPETKPSVFKVVLVGDPQIGKSSLLLRWMHDSFSEEYEPTISLEITTRDVMLDRGDSQMMTARLQIWDMGFGEPDAAGQFPILVGGAACAMLMYDCTSEGSVDGVVHWYEQVRSLIGSGGAFFVVGCKSDCPAPPGIMQKVRAFSESIEAPHFETSARNGNRSAAKVFEAVAREVQLRSLAGQVPPALPPSLPLSPAVAKGRSLGSAVESAGTAGAVPEWSAVSSAAPNSGVDSKLQDNVPPLTAVPTAEVRPAMPGGSVKLVLVGDPGVGKSVLAQRLGGIMQDAIVLDEDYMPTAGPEILTRQVAISGTPVLLQVWDAAGQDFRDIGKVCSTVLQDAAIAFVVYDVTVRASFDALPEWLELLKAQAGPDVAVALVGNKSDVAVERCTVSLEEAKVLGEALAVPSVQVSGKLGWDFSDLLCQLLAAGRQRTNWAAVGAAGQQLEATPAPAVATDPRPRRLSDPDRTIAAIQEAERFVSGRTSPRNKKVPVKMTSAVASVPAVGSAPNGAASAVKGDASTVAVSLSSSRRRPEMKEARASQPKEPKASEPLPKRQVRGGSAVSANVLTPPGSSGTLSGPERRRPEQSGSNVPVDPSATSAAASRPVAANDDNSSVCGSDVGSTMSGGYFLRPRPVTQIEPSPLGSSAAPSPSAASSVSATPQPFGFAETPQPIKVASTLGAQANVMPSPTMSRQSSMQRLGGRAPGGPASPSACGTGSVQLPVAPPNVPAATVGNGPEETSQKAKEHPPEILVKTTSSSLDASARAFPGTPTNIRIPAFTKIDRDGDGLITREQFIKAAVDEVTAVDPQQDPGRGTRIAWTAHTGGGGSYMVAVGGNSISNQPGIRDPPPKLAPGSGSPIRDRRGSPMPAAKSGQQSQQPPLTPQQPLRREIVQPMQPTLRSNLRPRQMSPGPGPSAPSAALRNFGASLGTGGAAPPAVAGSSRQPPSISAKQPGPGGQRPRAVSPGAYAAQPSYMQGGYMR